MKVALIVPGFSRDGDEWAIPALQHLATSLAVAHEIHVFALRYPAPGRYTFDGLTVWATGGGTRFGAASLAIWRDAWQSIAVEHRRGAFDIFHAFWADEPGLVAVWAAARLRRPALVSVAGGELVYLADIDYGVQGSRVRGRLVDLALRRANAVTVGSRYLAPLAVRHGAAADRLHSAPLGFDERRFRPATAPPLDAPTLVQAASLAPVKDQMLLLEVLAHVARRRPRARLLLAGDGPERDRLAARAGQLGLQEKITLHGQSAYLDMAAVYARGHVYVQTSRHESQGLAVLEALATGCPAVGTPVGVLPEVAAAPPTFAAEELAGQIIALVSDTDVYARARATAVAAAKPFSSTATLANWLACYRDLAGRP